MVKCVYGEKLYEASFTTSDKTFLVMSKEPLNEESLEARYNSENIFYSTEVNVDEFSEIFLEDLYYNYNDSLFKVMTILGEKVYLTVKNDQRGL